MRKHFAKKLEPFVVGLKAFTLKDEHKFFCMLLNPEYCNFAMLARLVGQAGAKVIREQAKTALVEYMLKYEEFSTGALISDAPRQDVVCVMDDTGVPDASDDDSDGLQSPEAEAEVMRNARRGLLKEKLSKYLKFARQAANWQPPLPQPTQAESEDNKRPRFNCLAWWDLHEDKFPEVARQHDMWNSAPPAEESCERMFSIVGLLYNIRRRKMDMECLSDLVYIHQNYPNDATIDFHIVKNMDPGFTKDYQMPTSWADYLELEADMVDEDWEHLSHDDMLDVEPSADNEEDSDDDGEPVAILPFGMQQRRV